MPSVFLDNGVAGVFPEDATKGDLKRPKVLEILIVLCGSFSDESLRFFWSLFREEIPQSSTAYKFLPRRCPSSMVF